MEEEGSSISDGELTPIVLVCNVLLLSSLVR